MSLFDNLLRKLAEFLVVLQMFLMASCWPTPLDEYDENDADGEGSEGEEWEGGHDRLDDARRRPLGTVNG